ncbi:hypothetical protein H257_03373 [Aphanomyces astaci]|uniref:Uncharacterized protein n=1 Tax=Aphanomyces astaci TaxID=112090 RepID=W4GWB3_APHAT|nr:hypothetical protein H257_03373 [Aphanomyces astaci]ETV84015.1 hypothetical protein H257_03373 [Aphanomyces astaci]|eukprot:XP_009825707.1 hypothetical protein H257_03373 [Aphanomyces astaci]
MNANKSVAAGVIAGCATRTTTSPLVVGKILFQVKSQGVDTPRNKLGRTHHDQLIMVGRRMLLFRGRNWLKPPTKLQKSFASPIGISKLDRASTPHSRKSCKHSQYCDARYHENIQRYVGEGSSSYFHALLGSGLWKPISPSDTYAYFLDLDPRLLLGRVLACLRTRNVSTGEFPDVDRDELDAMLDYLKLNGVPSFLWVQSSSDARFHVDGFHQGRFIARSCQATIPVRRDVQ